MAESMRRLPTQRRSRETVARILAAAEQLLATIGYDRAVESPQLLLEEAGVSKGAFYAYFTSPDMAMETVALRYMEKSKAMADDFSSAPYDRWEQIAERAIEVYSDYYRDPAVRELWLKGHLSAAAVDADDRANLHIATRLWEAITRVAPGRTARLQIYHCAVAIEILDYLLRFAFRREVEGDPRLIREAAVAMTAYLHTAVD